MSESSSAAAERTELPVALRFGIAIIAVLSAQLANWAIPNGLYPAPFFVASIMISVQLGGRGPALLSFVLASALLDYFWVPPFNHFAIRADVLPSLLQFVVPSLVGAWFVE